MAVGFYGDICGGTYNMLSRVGQICSIHSLNFLNDGQATTRQLAIIVTMNCAWNCCTTARSDSPIAPGSDVGSSRPGLDFESALVKVLGLRSPAWRHVFD